MRAYLSKRSAAGNNTLVSNKRFRITGVAIFALLSLHATSLHATNPKNETVVAFERYVAETEMQMNSETGLAQFLIVDRLPDAERQNAYDQLHQGQAFIEELHTRKEGRPISIPNGLVHHWAGVIFIPKATLSETIAVLQNYDNQANIYEPDVRQAKLIKQDGDGSDVFEQFYSKSIVTVILNAYFHVVETPLGSGRCQSVSRSTRIVEVVNPDGTGARERTDGKDHGYMWRLNSYWRVEQKDGGVYVQNESVSLSRTVPVMLAWIVNPLTKSIPRDLLSRLLNDTRKAVESPSGASKPENAKQ